jgi:hypothetical protein
MRATQAIAAAFAAPAMFSCSDAQIACNSVTQNDDVTLANGQTAKQIGGFGTAAVWLT